jgi:hypothetical protein
MEVIFLTTQSTAISATQKNQKPRAYRKMAMKVATVLEYLVVLNDVFLICCNGEIIAIPNSSSSSECR